jgi:hypothetical protein
MPSPLTRSHRPQSPLNLKSVFLCFAFAIMLPVGAWAQTPPPFDAAHANAYFEEARRVSEKDGGKLWGQTLYANSSLPQARAQLPLWSGAPKERPERNFPVAESILNQQQL